MSEMTFVNLTPYTTDVLDDNGEQITTVKPSGTVALALGEQVMNVPEPEDEKIYIVLPAIAEACDRDDVVSVSMEEAQRSYRGNVRSHVCYWRGQTA